MSRIPARPSSAVAHSAPRRAARARGAKPERRGGPTISDDQLATLLEIVNDGLLVLRADGSATALNATAKHLLVEGRNPLLDDLPLERVFAGVPLRDALVARDLASGDEQLLAASALTLPNDEVALLLRDITTTAQLTARIAVSEQQQRVLARASARLDGSLDLDDVLHASVELATELLGFTMAWLALPNETDDTLDLLASHDTSGYAVNNLMERNYSRLPIASTLTGQCFNMGRSLMVENAQIDAFYRSVSNDRLNRLTQAYGAFATLLLPLIIRGRTIGVLGVLTTRRQPHVTPDDIARAETLASRVAVAVEHARLHREAQSLQHFYRSVTNSASALLLTLDRQLRMTWANGEWDRVVHWLNMPDLLWHNVQGTSIVPLLPPSRLAELIETARQFLREDTPGASRATYQTELDVTLGGLSLTLLVNVRPRGSQQGQVEGLTVAVTDVSHLKRLEAALRERHDALQRTQVQLVTSARLAATGELIAGVAHELNNPLTSVLGWTDLMLDEGDVSLDSVRRIHESALRARRIVQGLLTFARQVPNERSWTDLGELADTVVALKAADFRRNAVGLHLKVAQHLPRVLVDGGQIQQVLLNLLSNAEQAMRPHGGDISLTIAQEGDEIAISVEDTGPGIPPEALERIFEPFFTTKPPGEGTGLGLAISHGIVQAHGGSLVAENTPRGACFTLRLPLRNPHSTAHPADLNADERGRARTQRADYEVGP